MKKILPLLLVALSTTLTTTARATEPTEIAWSDLAPPPPEVEMENPFDALAPEQLNSLRLILRLELSQAKKPDSEGLETARKLRAELTAEGIDVDALFAQRLEIMNQRRIVAERTNTDILDKPVRLPGYVLPLELKDEKVTEFILVATVGACIHTPTPPANQMVYVQYPEGIVIDGRYKPFWITGKLLDQASNRTVLYFDGQADVHISYAMQPDRVEPYTP